MASILTVASSFTQIIWVLFAKMLFLVVEVYVYFKFDLDEDSTLLYLHTVSTDTTKCSLASNQKVQTVAKCILIHRKINKDCTQNKPIWSMAVTLISTVYLSTTSL